MLLRAIVVVAGIGPGVLLAASLHTALPFALIPLYVAWLMFARWAARDAEAKNYDPVRAEFWVLLLGLPFGPAWWLVRRRRVAA